MAPVAPDVPQANASAACQANAFYIENGRINLCPEACSTVRADPSALIGVLFTCESTIIVE